MKVEITIPAHNDEATIIDSVNKLLQYCKSNLQAYDYKIIVAENGSKDSTYTVAEAAFKNNPKVEVLKLALKGRGRVLMHIWGNSKADISMYMDSDLSTDLKHTGVLLEKLAKEHYDIAIGSRLLKQSEVKRSFKRELVGRTNVFITRLLLNSKISDYNCGFKAATYKTIQQIFPLIHDEQWKPDGRAWFWDIEFLIMAEREGLKIYEEPVKWIDDHPTTVKLGQDIKESLQGVFRLMFAKE
ncbi:MAG: hypothetical protein Fur003_4870 [Candidatus Dojkabacteria bacterium]